MLWSFMEIFIFTLIKLVSIDYQSDFSITYDYINVLFIDGAPL